MLIDLISFHLSQESEFFLGEAGEWLAAEPYNFDLYHVNLLIIRNVQ